MVKYKIDDKVTIKKGAIGVRQASERKKVIGQRGVIRTINRKKGKLVYVVQIGVSGWLDNFHADALRKVA